MKSKKICKLNKALLKVLIFFLLLDFLFDHSSYLKFLYKYYFICYDLFYY